MTLHFSDAQTACPVHLVEADRAADVVAALPAAQQAWAAARDFSGKLGQVCILPAADGAIDAVLFGMGDAAARARGRLHVAGMAAKLPAGDYRLETGASDQHALAWLLSTYRFTRFKAAGAAPARLVSGPGIDAPGVQRIAAGAALTQDLINTPANHLGPDALDAAVHDLAAAHGARVTAVRGDDLLSQNFPMIHAVGRAADQAPRLLDLTWGADDAPKVTLVGKGVCFDTGGLNIKPGSAMALMKKDMGGAATTMGLASMIMDAALPVRLRLLVPAVENAISAGAFRPQDILTSRSGKTVEINNTDAEGRLVLADALSLADEETPATLICMATLTGAARVALGPDLMPFYTDDAALAADLAAAAERVEDPLWRMPFWPPYEEVIEPGIADLDNAPSGGFAGSITAALFLRRFVDNTAGFAHFDIYGWTPAAKPGRPKGGACQAARAVFDMLCHRHAG